MQTKTIMKSAIKTLLTGLVCLIVVVYIARNELSVRQLKSDSDIQTDKTIVISTAMQTHKAQIVTPRAGAEVGNIFFRLQEDLKVNLLIVDPYGNRDLMADVSFLCIPYLP